MRRNIARLCSFRCQCRAPRIVRTQTTSAIHSSADFPDSLPPRYNASETGGTAPTPEFLPNLGLSRDNTDNPTPSQKSSKIADVSTFVFSLIDARPAASNSNPLDLSYELGYPTKFTQ